MTSLAMPAGWDIAEINRWLDYHGEATKAMTKMRTALESKLIPITAYIVISTVECYRRHPELVVEIDRAMPAEEIGRRARVPGNQVDSVHIWSQANIFLLGRNILTMLGRLTPADAPERVAIVLDFWKRVAGAFRGDGELQAYDANFTCRPYADVVDRFVDACEPVREDEWRQVKRLNATLTSYLFLLYFDTRSGMVDTGPYDLGGGRTLLVRDFSKMGPSDFWWSAEVASALPYQNLTAAFILKDVDVKITDWGTSITSPEHYLDHVERFGLFTTDGGGLRRVDATEVGGIRAATSNAQKALYRHIAKMSRNERIDAGAYVYFSFLRPFADVAGVGEALDWTCPRDSLDVYDMLSGLEGSNTPSASDEPYYPAFPS